MKTLEELKKDINSLDELADYINSCDDYPLEVEALCEAKGWDVCKSDYDIALDHQNNKRLSFNEQGSVEVYDL